VDRHKSTTVHSVLEEYFAPSYPHHLVGVGVVVTVAVIFFGMAVLATVVVVVDFVPVVSVVVAAAAAAAADADADAPVALVVAENVVRDFVGAGERHDLGRHRHRR